jgi:hypothetical protein
MIDLHKLYRRAVPVSLPLNAERVVLVIAYGDLQMRQWDLAVEPGGRWYADVVVLHCQALLLHAAALVVNVDANDEALPWRYRILECWA